MKITSRELPIEEAEKLLTVPPFDKVGYLPNLAHTRIAVSEDEDGKILAYCYVFDAVHIEPLWISPEHRNVPKVMHGIWDTVHKILKDDSIEMAFATIADEQSLTHIPMFMKLGFKPIPARLYFLITNPEEESQAVLVMKKLSEDQDG